MNRRVITRHSAGRSMHSQKMLALLALVVVLPSVSNGQQQTQPQQNIPTRMTRQPDFGIPFQLSPNSPVAPAEVRLYLSAQQGRDWKLYQRQATSASGFQFRAPADGEYWFAVRTADPRGQLISHQSWQPELKVVVDTRMPQLDLRLKVDASGKATAEWVAQDANLAPHTFRMQYQDQQGQWKDVSVQTPAADQWQQEWQERAQWWVSPNGRELLVRAEILDRAGNVTTVNKTVSLAQTANRAPDRFDDVASRSADSGRAQQQQSEALADKWEKNRSGLDGQLPAWLSDVQHSEDAFGAAPSRELWRDRPKDGADRQDFANEPISSSIEPPVANRFQEVSASARRQDIRPRITDSPSFELEYELFDVGPLGVRMVELWFTRDRGKTWELYGSDSDKQSPMEVEVKKQGLYGFRLVVHGHDAATPRPPEDGEPADIWIGVDWAKPFARIHRAAYGLGAEQDTVVIEWQAEDALLSELPITLNYSQSPQGPWTPIKVGLPNSGVYRWRPRQQLPALVYVQMEVGDLVGNVTSDTYTSPVTRRGAAPRGRIRDMRPLDQASTFEPFRRR